MILVITTLKDRLSTLSSLKYIDENTGQLDYYGSNPPVNWPCALISIASAKFSDLSIDRTQQPVNRQMGELLIEIQIANLKLTGSSAAAPVFQKEKALIVLQILEEVHKALHGWSPGGNIGKFIRQGIQQQQRDDGIQLYSVFYSLSVSDC